MSKTTVLDIPERAQRALTTSPIFALRDLRVEKSGSRLLIIGSVSTFYHKQLAQEVVRAVAEELQVAEELEVINSIEVR